MRYEMIISYEIEDGKKVNTLYEGDLIRCADCIRYKSGPRGAYCMGKRVSPLGYCDKAEYKN